jgi:hypothetical protein
MAGCGGSAAGPGSPGGPGSSGGQGTSGTPTTTRAPLPAGPLPARVTRMVCDDEERGKIAEVLGLKAHVPAPTWSRRSHVYSCVFEYPRGDMVLDVKELSSWSETLSYFHGLARRLGDTDSLGNLGQGAFVTRDGSVVVRKDWKVLLVDVAALPRRIGKPPATPAGVAYSVADVILGCWEGD